MNNLLVKIVFMSISGSVIAGILLLIRRFIKLRFSQSWQYYIWLAVIFRLLIPYSPEINLMTSIYNFVENQFQIKNITINIPFNGAADNFIKYMGTAWLYIFILLMIKKVISYKVYIRFMKKNRKEITDVSILNIYGEVRESLGAGRNIGLYSYAFIDSPMLIGFINPYILLPEAMLKYPDKLKYILLHETIHYRRKDFLYKWLVQIISCLYFFNPIVILLQKEINRNCELSCDEIAVRYLDNGGKKAYGSALLYTMATVNESRRPVPVSLMMCEDTKQIKERLNAIMRYKPNSFLITAESGILTAAICFCTIHVGIFKVTYTNNGICDCIINQFLKGMLR